MSEASEIMKDMDRTREEIRSTLGAIAERFTVDSLMQQVVTPAKEGTVELGRALGDAARANPVAVGLTAIGLGWLMFGTRPADGNGRRRLEKAAGPALEAGRSAAHDVADAAGRMTGKIRRSAERVGERASDALERGRAKVEDFGEEASERAYEAGERLRGRAAERTGRASSAVRHSADRAYDRARDTAEDVGSRVRKRADDARHSVREGADRAREYAQDTAETARGYLREGAGRARDYVQDTADSARDYVREGAGRAREYLHDGKDRARHYLHEGKDKARHYLHDGSDRAREYAREGAEYAGRVGGYVRDGAGRAGGYVREGAHRTTSYAREHPLAVGAVLVVGGATLALMLARRAPASAKGCARDSDDEAGMPETPYASGYQAVDEGLHRNETVAITPEEEDEVYAAGDVSTEARPEPGSADDSDAVREEDEGERDEQGDHSTKGS